MNETATNHTRHASTASRSGRGILVAGSASVLLLAGCGTVFDPYAMSQGEIDTELAEITSAHREAFYLGREADGEDLAVIEELDGVLFFEYGRCLDNDEGGCNRPLNVTSQPTHTFGSRGEDPEPCERLRPVLGVPAADMAGSLTVFTGSSIVSVTSWDVVSNGYVPDQTRQASLALQLRPVGETTAVKALPPPDSDTQAFVDQHCGPEPHA